MGPAPFLPAPPPGLHRRLLRRASGSPRTAPSVRDGRTSTRHTRCRRRSPPGRQGGIAGPPSRLPRSRPRPHVRACLRGRVEPFRGGSAGRTRRCRQPRSARGRRRVPRSEGRARPQQRSCRRPRRPPLSPLTPSWDERSQPFSSTNSVGTVAARLTSSLAALTYRTIVGRSPFSLSFPCIIPFTGSSSFLITSFHLVYGALMMNFAFSPSSAPIPYLESRHCPCHRSSHAHISSPTPLSGSGSKT